MSSATSRLGSPFDSLSCTSSFVDWEAEERAADDAEAAQAALEEDDEGDAVPFRRAKNDYTFRHGGGGGGDSDDDDDSPFPFAALHQSIGAAPSVAAAPAAQSSPQPRNLGQQQRQQQEPGRRHPAPVYAKVTAAQAALQRPLPRPPPPQVAKLAQANAPTPESSSASLAPVVFPSDPHFAASSGHSTEGSFDQISSLPATVITDQRLTQRHQSSTGQQQHSSQHPLAEREGSASSGSVGDWSRNSVSSGDGRDAFPAQQSHHAQPPPLLHSSQSDTTTTTTQGSGSSHVEAHTLSPPPRASTEQYSGPAIPSPTLRPRPFLSTDLAGEGSGGEEEEEEAGEARNNNNNNNTSPEGQEDGGGDGAHRSPAAAASSPSSPSSLRLRWREFQEQWEALPPLSPTSAASLAILLLVLPLSLMVLDWLLYRRLVAALVPAGPTDSTPNCPSAHSPSSLSGTSSSADCPSASPASRPSGQSISLLAARLVWVMFPHGLLVRLHKSDWWARLMARLRDADSVASGGGGPNGLAQSDTMPTFLDGGEGGESKENREGPESEAAEGEDEERRRSSGSIARGNDDNDSDNDAAAIARELTIIWLGICETLLLFLPWAWARLRDRTKVDPYLALAGWCVREGVVVPVTSHTPTLLTGQEHYHPTVTAAC